MTQIFLGRFGNIGLNHLLLLHFSPLLDLNFHRMGDLSVQETHPGPQLGNDQAPEYVVGNCGHLYFKHLELGTARIAKAQFGLDTPTTVVSHSPQRSPHGSVKKIVKNIFIIRIIINMFRQCHSLKHPSVQHCYKLKKK